MIFRGTIHFKNIGPNHVVPQKPWPQVFYISRSLLEADAVEVRPLTLAGIAKGVGQNFVTINWWRLCWSLRGLGFLNTEECARYGWSDLTPCFWRYHELRRFKCVRASDRYYRSVRAWLASTFSTA